MEQEVVIRQNNLFRYPDGRTETVKSVNAAKKLSRELQKQGKKVQAVKEDHPWNGIPNYRPKVHYTKRQMKNEVQKKRLSDEEIEAAKARYATSQ